MRLWRRNLGIEELLFLSRTIPTVWFWLKRALDLYSYLKTRGVSRSWRLGEATSYVIWSVPINVCGPGIPLGLNLLPVPPSHSFVRAWNDDIARRSRSGMPID